MSFAIQIERTAGRAYPGRSKGAPTRRIRGFIGD